MLDKEELKRRISYAIRHAERGVQAAIAKEVGITEQAVSGWKSSGKVDKAYLPVLSKHTKRKLSYFLDSSVTDRESGIDSDELEWPSVLGYAQSAGLGTNAPEAAEWAETHKLKFRRDSLAKKRLNPSSLAVMYGSGDSMEPTIKDGDAILFDTSDTTPKNRGVYVLLIPGAGNDEYIVKRAVVTKGAVAFVADNLAGDHDWKDPRPLSGGIKVVGRVRWTGGWIR